MTSSFKQTHTNVRVSTHAVPGSNTRGEARTGQEVIYLAARCFQGAEKALWNAPGVVTTATGYMGGHPTNPAYEQVCSHSTGHVKTVHVVFDTVLMSVADFVRLFSEIRNLTQVSRQGNDVGDQYRSAIWATMPKQLRNAIALRTAYQEVFTKCGLGPIRAAISPAPDADSITRLWYTEGHHQQHLFKNLGSHECHAHTDIACPALPHKQPTRETDVGWADMCAPARPTSREISSRPGCR